MLYLIGFTTPWNALVHLDAQGVKAHTWGVLAATLAQLRVVAIGAAFEGLLVAAIGCAILGAFLRSWGSSYLGAGVVESGTFHLSERTASPGMIQAGPYRYVRNPLYLGTIFHTLALALMMPVSGAIFILVSIPLLQMRLIVAEESFLAPRLGMAYEAYQALVPRLLPALYPRIPRIRMTQQWGQAVLSECYMWFVAATYATVGWEYNSWMVIKGIVISFGISLVLRAIFPQRIEPKT